MVRDHVKVATAARQVAGQPEAMSLHDLVAEIAARRDEFDRLSHVPRDVIASMKRAGIFRAATPRRFGGDARPPDEFLRMIEAIAVADGSAAGASGVREVGNVKLMARSVENIEMKDLKSLADDGKKQLGSGVVAIVGVTGDGKAGVVVGVTSDLTSRFNAVDLARVASQVLGGKGGGGRPDMAQAGGPDASRADAALAAIEAAVAGTAQAAE